MCDSNLTKTAACLSLILMQRRQRRKRLQKKRSCWVKDWIQRRSEHGAMENLLRELQAGDELFYKNFLRLSARDFDYLLQKVSPVIQKQDTLMRKSIPAEERLALTLRFLATGKLYIITKKAIQNVFQTF